MLLILGIACGGASWSQREALDDGTYQPLPSTRPAHEDAGTPAGSLGPPEHEPKPEIGPSSSTREGSAGPPLAVPE